MLDDFELDLLLFELFVWRLVSNEIRELPQIFSVKVVPFLSFRFVSFAFQESRMIAIKKH